MSRSQYDLIQIAKAGAGLVVDGSKFTKYELIDIAKAINEGCTLEVQNCSSKTKYELIEIAESTKTAKVMFKD